MADTIVLGSSAWILAMVLALAGLGLVRGVRAEGITLAGLIATSVVLTTDAMRGRLVAIINKLPKIVGLLLGPEDTALASTTSPPLLATPDQRLMFYLLFFLGGAILFYVAGSIFGGTATSWIHRVAGLLMGAVSGFVISIALSEFSKDYLSRHPSPGPIRIDLPSFISPALPASNPLAQYTPLVFLLALGGLAFLVFTSLVRSKKS